MVTHTIKHTAKDIRSRISHCSCPSLIARDKFYGFNNQEQDSELGVSIKNCVYFAKEITTHSTSGYAFEYRIHSLSLTCLGNARLGRFLSVDPLEAEYPWNSPDPEFTCFLSTKNIMIQGRDAFAENTVIMAIDLEGCERKVEIDVTSSYLSDEEIVTLPDGTRGGFRGFTLLKTFSQLHPDGVFRDVFNPESGEARPDGKPIGMARDFAQSLENSKTGETLTLTLHFDEKTKGYTWAGNYRVTLNGIYTDEFLYPTRVSQMETAVYDIKAQKEEAAEQARIRHAQACSRVDYSDNDIAWLSFKGHFKHYGELANFMEKTFINTTFLFTSGGLGGGGSIAALSLRGARFFSTQGFSAATKFNAGAIGTSKTFTKDQFLNTLKTVYKDHPEILKTIMEGMK